jgi:signal transduction histidine kinase
MLVVLAGDILVPVGPLGAAGLEAGVVVAFLAGQSRRQYVLAEARSRELVEEQARADVLAARTQIASDIHDLLAHSLGGLVIQLDAVDALLDSGDADAAAAKVRDARLLAKEGLGEARRAVAALSSEDHVSDEQVSGEALIADITALIDSHRTLGGTVRLAERGHRAGVSAQLALALRRAVQEGLTNARKHAPGKPVTIALNWRADGVTVEISNPLGIDPANESDGHGLVGMRERFSALPGGAVTAEANGNRFVVTASAQLA